MTVWTCIKLDLQRSYQIETGGDGLPTKVGLVKKFLSPRFYPVFWCRVAQYAYLRGHRVFAKAVSMLNFHLYGIEISPRCEIGPGLYLPHTHGTVIGAWKIGNNCVIYQGVTLGAKALDLTYNAELRPTLGDGVLVGAGAKVLGGIHLGDGSVVGANAVVTKNVAPGETVVGIPARPIKTS